MNDIEAMIDSLTERGVRLRPDGGSIAVEGHLTDHDRAQLTSNKQGILEVLRERAGLCPRCGRGAALILSPQVQVRDLRALKAMQSEYHQWAEEAYVLLELSMQPGDEIVNRFAHSVIVRRQDGTRYEVTSSGHLK